MIKEYLLGKRLKSRLRLKYITYRCFLYYILSLLKFLLFLLLNFSYIRKRKQNIIKSVKMQKVESRKEIKKDEEKCGIQG